MKCLLLFSKASRRFEDFGGCFFQLATFFLIFSPFLSSRRIVGTERMLRVDATVRYVARRFQSPRSLFLSCSTKEKRREAIGTVSLGSLRPSLLPIAVKERAPHRSAGGCCHPNDRAGGTREGKESPPAQLLYSVRNKSNCTAKVEERR